MLLINVLELINIDGDQSSAGVVDTAKLATFLSNPENNFSKGAHKACQIVYKIKILFTDLHIVLKDHGAVTNNGSNSSVYVAGGNLMSYPDVIPLSIGIYETNIYRVNQTVNDVLYYVCCR